MGFTSEFVIDGLLLIGTLLLFSQLVRKFFEKRRELSAFGGPRVARDGDPTYDRLAAQLDQLRQLADRDKQIAEEAMRELEAIKRATSNASHHPVS
jgi:hypothetical protein